MPPQPFDLSKHFSDRNEREAIEQMVSEDGYSNWNCCPRKAKAISCMKKTKQIQFNHIKTRSIVNKCLIILTNQELLLD